MNNDAKTAAAGGLAGVSARLDELRRFAGSPVDFWHLYLGTLSEAIQATTAIALYQESDGSQQVWRTAGVWLRDAGERARADGLTRELVGVAAEIMAEGCVVRPVQAADIGRTTLAGVKLLTGAPNQVCCAGFLLSQRPTQSPSEIARFLMGLSCVPELYQSRRLLDQVRTDVVHFSSALDLMALLNAQTRYMAAAMTLCNEMAARHGCERVSLGWRRGEYIRLSAISHTEKFERKMDLVRRIEAAMEEAMDQDEEVLWPPQPQSSAIARDHEAMARELGLGFICSVPLRYDDRVAAVLTCERSRAAFTAAETGGLRLYCDQAARRLGDLRRRDRWFAARWCGAARELLAKALGPEHTWAKLGILLVAGLLGYLFLGTGQYRVSAPFLVYAEKIVALPAPFDGYIAEVHAKVGDAAEPAQVLLRMDTRDLLLEEAGALAEQQRYQREADKARAEDALAAMQIALAQAEQTRARLDLVRYRLSQAAVAAPFQSVVISGDLEECIGSPVRQGDELYRLARLDQLYVEAEIDESDIDVIAAGSTGAVAFASNPRTKHPVRVERLDPAAQAKSGKNVVIVRCAFTTPVGPWCRPGMSGTAKIDVGRRPLHWIYTHRTVDFLRLRFWTWW